jgi:oligopeptide transport system substrate-binding protein
VVRRQRRGIKLLALMLGLSMIAAACGGDDDDDEGSAGAENEGVQGGELVDLGTFVGDPPEHIDPALNVTLDAYQVVNSMYDGLTEIDSSDPENVEIVPQVAESYEANDDATTWTFTIREGLSFSNGEPVLPSSFKRAWERAAVPEFAGDYSYLIGVFIEGGQAMLDGEADEISGVTADDDAMTLTVDLAAPYANFDAVAGFQIFMPMPEAVEELDDQNDWENGDMIGNGPFMLEEARTDQEIRLVPNPEWDGTQYDEALGLPEQPRLDRLIFRSSEDAETAYNSFEAGEGDTANLVPGRLLEADENYATTLDVQIFGTLYFEIDWEDANLGGPENVLIRQAISQAINREEINEQVYEGTRTVVDGVVPPGMPPGWEPTGCDYCTYDPEAAEDAYQQWQDEGNEITEPIRIQYNLGQEHGDTVAIIIDNLDAIGIPAEEQPIDQETYFTQLADGACTICRSGWYADYPVIDNFMTDLFSSDAIGGNNHGAFSVPEFDETLAEARSTVDEGEQAELFHQAEDILLNENVGVLPLLWYRGEYAYNPETVANFPQNNFGLVQWETVSLQEGQT